MPLKLISAPTVEPITLPEARAQQRVEHDVDNALIQAFIVSAREQAEHILQRALITQTWERVMDAFPCDGAVELGMPPVQSIVSVKYAAPDGTEQTLDPAAYSLDPEQVPGWLLPARGYSWPSTLDTANAVRVRFICGYGANGSFVPQSIKDWMHLHVGHFYCNRKAASDKKLEPLPYADRLLDRYRTWL